MTAECSYLKKKKKKGFISTWVWNYTWYTTLRLNVSGQFLALQVIVCQQRCNNYLLILFYPKRISSILENGIHNGEGQLGIFTIASFEGDGSSRSWEFHQRFCQVLNLIHLDSPAQFELPLTVYTRAAYYPMVPMRISWTWQCLRIPGGLECSKQT